ncbi:MAG: 4-hydroxythreonine-4-phosphate dehydrogenase PdxA, partial [Proteobacteria bacterium]|nr:4-hydroxythreonine-4-phosphate dehydrogenase PdxA [Pseudomonadota bacterium]
MSKSRSDDRPTLIITPGEPAGIGPDICLNVVGLHDHGARLIFVADPKLLAQRASQLGIQCRFNDITGSSYRDDAMNLHPVSCAAPVVPGEASTANASYVLATLEEAVRYCLAGDAQGMVTGPVNKAIINDAGIPFSGHTEWLAERTGTPRVVMMLAGGNLRVALATTHLPLSAVPAAL